MRRAWCNGRLLVLAWLAVLVARATPVQFDIPPQPAHTALLAFSKQSRLDVLFPLEELKRKNSPGVVGAYEPEVALAKILAGTGYAAQQGAKGKFVIAPVVAQAKGRWHGEPVSFRARYGNDCVMHSRTGTVFAF